MSFLRSINSLALAFCFGSQTFAFVSALPVMAKDKNSRVRAVNYNQTQFLIDLSRLDRLIDSGKIEDALAFAQSMEKPSTVPFRISLNYRLSFLYGKSGNHNEGKKLLNQALLDELALDLAMEKEDRKKIHPNEFKTGQLESNELFLNRYKLRSKSLKSSDFSEECKQRAHLLLLRERYLDCYYLCLTRSVSLKTNTSDRLENLRSIAAMHCNKPFVKLDHPKLKRSLESLLKCALQAELQGHYDYAEKLYEMVIEQKPQDFYLENLARLYLANCFRKNHQFEQSVENYKLVLDAASGKTKGMKDSLAYKTLSRRALSGLEYYGADTAHLILKEKEAAFKKLSDEDKQKYISRLYDAGYKLKAAGHGRKAQELFWICVTLYRKYFPEKETALAGVLYDLSESYYWNEAFDPAIELMEQCIDLRAQSSENLDALDTMGRIYVAASDGKMGMAAFARLLYTSLKEIAPDAVSTYTPGNIDKLIKIAIDTRPKLEADKRAIIDVRLQGLIDGLIACKDFDQALFVARTLFKWKEAELPAKSDSIMDSLWQIGWLSRNIHKEAEARDCYSRLIENFSSRSVKWLGTWYFERGLAFDCMGDYKNASKDFQNALTILRRYYKEKEADMDFDEKEYMTTIIFDINLELKYKKLDPPSREHYLRSFPMYVFRWNKERAPLRIYIDKSRKEGFGPRLVETIDTIVKDWMNTKGLSLTWQYVDSAQDCDIHIKRAENHDNIPAGSGGRAKSEFVYVEKGEPKELNKSTLLIYCPSFDGEDLSHYAMQQMKNLAMHEFGHALGLGHSPNGMDIMYWKAPALELSQRDRNTLIHLYSK